MGAVCVRLEISGSRYSLLGFSDSRWRAYLQALVSYGAAHAWDPGPLDSDVPGRGSWICGVAELSGASGRSLFRHGRALRLSLCGLDPQRADPNTHILRLACCSGSIPHRALTGSRHIIPVIREFAFNAYRSAHRGVDMPISGC